jgi:hypothetical protein
MNSGKENTLVEIATCPPEHIVELVVTLSIPCDVGKNLPLSKIIKIGK